MSKQENLSSPEDNPKEIKDANELQELLDILSEKQLPDFIVKIKKLKQKLDSYAFYDDPDLDASTLALGDIKGITKYLEEFPTEDGLRDKVSELLYKHQQEGYESIFRAQQKHKK